MPIRAVALPLVVAATLSLWPLSPFAAADRGQPRPDAQTRRIERTCAGIPAPVRQTNEKSFDTGGENDRVLVQWVSGRYHSGLGVPMAIGRGIGDADINGHERVAVLSYRYWMHRFGGDRAAIGGRVYLNGLPTTIIGVTTPSFFGVDRGISPDVTIPLPNPSPVVNLRVMVRMRPGASDRQARAELDMALQRAIDSIRPGWDRRRDGDRKWMLTLHAALRPAGTGLGIALKSYVTPLRVLIVLSGVVLLIACLNITNLLLARALARTQEFGMRLALGAGRGRLIRQVITESALLASIGAAAGVGVAFAVHRWLVHVLLQDLQHQSIGFVLNTHVLAFSLLTTVATVLFSGLVPAIRATRMDILASLRTGTSGGHGRRRGLAKSLVAVQVAGALVLLVGAALLVRSFRNVSAIDLGLPVDHVLTMRIGLDARETGHPQPPTAYRTIVQRVEAVPGVQSAALGWDFSLSSGTAGKSIWVEGQPPGQSQSAGFNVVGPRFFRTVGIPVIAGREFTDADAAGSRKVVIVNEALVRRYFGGQYAVGRHLGDDGAASIGKYEVVGVVADARTMFLREAPGPMLYQPLMQDDWASNAVLHVRTCQHPALLEGAVRAAVRTVDPRLPIYDVTTLSARRGLALQRDRIMATLSATFGVLALALTAIGVFGVIAYSVARRRSEIGVRIAIGATASDIRRLVIGETLRLLGIGAAIGVALSLASARALSSLLFGIAPQDPWTLAGCVLLLITAGCAAGALPANRAARIEPMAALRAD